MELLNIFLSADLTFIEGILSLMDRYGVSLVALIVIGIFAWILVKFILKRMKEQEKKMNMLIDKIINQDEGLTEEKMDKFAVNSGRVQQLMYNLLNDFDADRISVYEFHNGGKTISGVDFKKCSNTFEAVNIGIEEKYKDRQNIPISINFLWNKLLIDKKPILISDICSLEKTDNTIFQILKAQGIKSYYSRLINDYNAKPIGFIVVTYYNSTNILSDEQLKKLSDISINIGGLINKD